MSRNKKEEEIYEFKPEINLVGGFKRGRDIITNYDEARQKSIEDRMNDNLSKFERENSISGDTYTFDWSISLIIQERETLIKILTDENYTPIVVPNKDK